MDSQVAVNAYAKVNLTLNVGNAQGGRHIIDSIATSADLADAVFLRKRNDGEIKVSISGQGLESLPQEENNAYKAALLFMQAFKCGGADIEIKKNIPVGAGLGGSAADAAAVLNGMVRLYKIKNRAAVLELAKKVSGDTLFMTLGGFGLVQGTGDIVKRIKSNLKLFFLCLIPKGGVSTKECFEGFDKLPKMQESDNAAVEKALKKGDFDALCANLGNMLTSSAMRLNSGILPAFERLKAVNPQPVNMSGAGSAVYALYDNIEAAKSAQRRCGNDFLSLVFASV